MANAAAAVLAAAGMFVEITPSSTTGHPGQRITLDGSGSTAAIGYSIASYQWTTDPATSGQIANANQSIAELTVPSFRTITVILTITDNIGRTDSASVTIRSALGEASGVGAMRPAWLGLLSIVVLWRLWVLRQLGRRRDSPERVLGA
jgi:hypothetical protein